MVASFYLIHAIYTRKQASLREKQNQLDVVQSQINTQEQTFQKISCEIHDNISLTLSLSKIYLHDIDFTDQNDAHDKINLSVCLIKKAMDDLNNLSRSLNAESIQKFGLLKSVQQLVNDIGKAELFRISLNIKGTGPPPGATDELIIFRMVQEILNNIIRHAGATEVIIWMDFEKSNLRIRVYDDGIGFDPNDSCTPGTGLDNLKKRAQIINAGLHIESAPHQGTTIKILIPLTTIIRTNGITNS
jgi:two-component system, NarL family, sensor kinase